MKNLTLKKLIESTNIPETLVRSVVRQLGGWRNFTESAPDICRHGIDGGYGKFLYYRDTIPFFKRNREAILEMAKEQAEQFGSSLVEMIGNFGCFRNCKPSEVEIIEALAGRVRDTQVPNALAWYAGEEVARAYDDLCESVKDEAEAQKV